MLKNWGLEEHDDAVARAFNDAAFYKEALRLPYRLTHDDMAGLEGRNDRLMVRQYREFAGRAGQCDGNGGAVEARLPYRSDDEMECVGMIGHMMISLKWKARGKDKFQNDLAVRTNHNSAYLSLCTRIVVLRLRFCFSLDVP